MANLICLMPTYNKAQTLEKAIESVLMQKTKHGFKLLILDDASTDGSSEIAKNYQEKYPDKIEIFSQNKNSGLLKTTLEGYDRLKGADYYCVLDADDWYIYDKKFDEAINFLEKNIEYGQYITNVLMKDGNIETPMIDLKKQSFGFSFEDFLKGKGVFIQTGGTVFRNIFFKNGLPDEFREFVNKDYPRAFCADAFRQPLNLSKSKAYFNNHIESVYNYTNTGDWSSLNQIEQDIDNIAIYCELANFFKEHRNTYLLMAKRLFEALFKKEKNLVLDIKDEKAKKGLTLIIRKLYIENTITDIRNKPKKLIQKILYKIYKYCSKKLIEEQII